MAEVGGFRGAIDFLGEIGIYDVVLPFLLVFTIIFAVLEKTKILGYEKINDKQYTKKNLNSMVAFIIAFLVIASTRLVSIINDVMANVVLLVILALSFLLLVGVFMGDQESTLKDYPGWAKFFMVVMFIGIIVIFLNAVKVDTDTGEFTLLEVVLSVFQEWDAAWASSIIFLLIILLFMFYIVKEPTQKKEKKKDG
jgi:hypothetical protein